MIFRGLVQALAVFLYLMIKTIYIPQRVLVIKICNLLRISPDGTLKRKELYQNKSQ